MDPVTDSDCCAWPPITAETRPWTRWWWHGAAVDKPTLTRLLETYSRAGLGGVEITSIYGVQGQEHRSIAYLSPAWIDVVQHAIAEAHRLGMKVDLPPGSGWRIGGPYISDDIGAAKLVIEKSHSGVGYVLDVRPSGERVKRAGPGGAGAAFNPFSRASLAAVTAHYTPVFEYLGVRAQFHDSWEYESAACPELPDQFLRRRGYNLREYLDALVGDRGDELEARVKYDVQLTLAEMALDEFILPWTAWCHRLGQLSRNQAHGSPGNLLDLYAAADIPETEVFRDRTADTPLLSKFASSAAHVAGRRLVSSETGTWLKEHFTVSLADVKMLLDTLFVSGINHHVYHGTAYSPPDAQWPGWLFYASTQFNPQNTIWRDFHVLNAYAARCQSVLQDGTPDNDLLVYFPIHDVLHDPVRKLAAGLTIEGAWLRDLDAVETYRSLWRRGYGFDHVSDRQIGDVVVSRGTLVTRGGSYRALVVPPCRFMPVDTLETLIRISQQGARVLFLTPTPSDVPGWAALEERRGRFRALMKEVTVCDDIESALEQSGIRRERMADCPGMFFIRRRHALGRHYFAVNQSSEPIDEWIPLSVSCRSVLIMDPMSGKVGLAQTRPGGDIEVRIQLDPGASWILRTFTDRTVEADFWPYVEPSGPAHTLRGTWRLEFIEGGPELPAACEMDTLVSWTERGEAAERFAGTAVYRLTFDAPTEAHAWLLDLGEVHSSARVRLNGRDIGALIGPSFRTVLHDMRRTGNELEIEVTNLAANRIRDLDRRGVRWKIFEDINFVDRDYKPLDAADWPIRPSGLLGPVRLTPLQEISRKTTAMPGKET